MLRSSRTATTPALLLALCFGLLTACGDSDDDTPAQDTGADLGADAGGDAGADATEDVTPDAVPDTDATEEPWPLDDIAIAGEYVDNFGGAHVVTTTTWTQGQGEGASLFTFEGVWNDDEVAVAQNAPTNAFSPGLYSRFDWFQDGEDLWFCQTAYDAATAQLAFDATPADVTDLGAGCGGFGWSQLLIPE